MTHHRPPLQPGGALLMLLLLTYAVLANVALVRLVVDWLS